MQISKSIILPEWESIEDLDQASNILKQITEALKDHNLQNYDDAVANYRRITTGRIQSVDGETYFDLDSGVIRGEMIFRAGSSGLDNVEEASPSDWDNAFKLADAVKGDSDFTLISGGKIITESIAVGAFNSDVIARMFSSGEAHTNIEAWMKAGHITYIDGAKIYAGSITLTGLGSTIIEGGYIKTSLLQVSYGDITGSKPPVNADYFGGSAGALAYLNNVELAKLGTTIISGGYLRTDLIKVRKIYVGGGTDEDIYFEDSGIRLYDATGAQITFAKAGLASFSIYMNAAYSEILTTNLKIYASGNIFTFYSGGTFQLVNLSSAPTGHAGDLTYDTDGGVNPKFHGYIGSPDNAWGYWNLSAGW